MSLPGGFIAFRGDLDGTWTPPAESKVRPSPDIQPSGISLRFELKWALILKILRFSSNVRHMRSRLCDWGAQYPRISLGRSGLSIRTCIRLSPMYGFPKFVPSSGGPRCASAGPSPISPRRKRVSYSIPDQIRELRKTARIFCIKLRVKSSGARRILEQRGVCDPSNR